MADNKVNISIEAGLQVKIIEPPQIEGGDVSEEGYWAKVINDSGSNKRYNGKIVFVPHKEMMNNFKTLVLEESADLT